MSAVDTTTAEAKKGLTAQDRRDLRQLWLRSNLINGSMQSIKRQAMGFGYTMAPLLERIYKDDREALSDAMVRHTQYLNTNANTVTFMVGLTAALEKEKAEKGTVTGEVITNVKTALMGPLASIGDSIFQVTLRVIAAGIAITFAEQGSPLGALIFLAIFGGVWFGLRTVLLNLGYTVGTKYLSALFEQGLLESITKATSVIGLAMIGALASSLMKTDLALTLQVGETEVVFQDMINQIMPGMLSLIMLFAIYWLYSKKHFSVVKIVILLLVLGIALAFFGIM